MIYYVCIVLENVLTRQFHYLKGSQLGIHSVLLPWMQTSLYKDLQLFSINVLWAYSFTLLKKQLFLKQIILWVMYANILIFPFPRKEWQKSFLRQMKTCAREVRKSIFDIRDCICLPIYNYSCITNNLNFCMEITWNEKYDPLELSWTLQLLNSWTPELLNSFKDILMILKKSLF